MAILVKVELADAAVRADSRGGHQDKVQGGLAASRGAEGGRRHSLGRRGDRREYPGGDEAAAEPPCVGGGSAVHRQ